MSHYYKYRAIHKWLPEGLSIFAGRTHSQHFSQSQSKKNMEDLQQLHNREVEGGAASIILP